MITAEDIYRIYRKHGLRAVYGDAFTNVGSDIVGADVIFMCLIDKVGLAEAMNAYRSPFENPGEFGDESYWLKAVELLGGDEEFWAWVAIGWLWELCGTSGQNAIPCPCPRPEAYLAGRNASAWLIGKTPEERKLAYVKPHGEAVDEYV